VVGEIRYGTGVRRGKLKVLLPFLCGDSEAEPVGGSLVLAESIEKPT